MIFCSQYLQIYSDAAGAKPFNDWETVSKKLKESKFHNILFYHLY